jgi:WD40 repeat protein
VTKITWNPTLGTGGLSSLSAAVSPDRIEVLETTPDSVRLSYDIRGGHSRTITDVNWCADEPNLLASASADGFVRIWDRRTTEASRKRPKVALDAMVATSQVRNIANIFFRRKNTVALILSQLPGPVET